MKSKEIFKEDGLIWSTLRYVYSLYLFFYIFSIIIFSASKCTIPIPTPKLNLKRSELLFLNLNCKILNRLLGHINMDILVIIYTSPLSLKMINQQETVHVDKETLTSGKLIKNKYCCAKTSFFAICTTLVPTS